MADDVKFDTNTINNDVIYLPSEFNQDEVTFIVYALFSKMHYILGSRI